MCHLRKRKKPDLTSASRRIRLLVVVRAPLSPNESPRRIIRPCSCRVRTALRRAGTLFRRTSCPEGSSDRALVGWGEPSAEEEEEWRGSIRREDDTPARSTATGRVDPLENSDGGDVELDSGNPRPKVLLINTGGTLGMRKDETGGLAPVPGYFTSQMLQMGALANPEDMPAFDILEHEPLLDSSCFTPSDWTRIAEDIGRAYHSYDGFVVCMGTDTMAYAASALSFMLENLGKTVVFTGSQIPLAEVYNDARRNVTVAMIIAANQEIPEVCVFFANRLLRANRTVKVDSLALGAFESPKFPPLGSLGVTMQYQRDVMLPPPRRAFRVHTRMDSRVVVIKLVPGFDDDALLAVVEHCYALRAIVLELYGTGNSPSRREDFVRFIQSAKAKGVMVVVVSQCLRGGVNLGTYAVGITLQENGVVSGGDMTTEAAVTKLAYLFGRTDDLQLIKQLMGQNIRGELSPESCFKHPIFGGSGKLDAGHGIVERSYGSTPSSRSRL
ncbi:unnamed protein product [Ascophyllum nodosum]